MKYYVAVLTGCNKDAPRFLGVSDNYYKLASHIWHSFPGILIHTGPRCALYTADGIVDSFVINPEGARRQDLFQKLEMYNTGAYCGESLTITILEVIRPYMVFDLGTIKVTVI